MKVGYLILIVLLGTFRLSSEENFINPTGTYELESETTKDDEDIYGYYGEINIKLINYKQIIMTFFINKGAPSYNSGSFVDTLIYEKNKAIYKLEEDLSCKITFKFSEKGIMVTQESDDYNSGSGFGHAVKADGFFNKISS